MLSAGFGFVSGSRKKVALALSEKQKQTQQTSWNFADLN